MTLLQVRDLTVEIGGSRLIDGVSFDVPEGATTALLGRNGAGKTTTLRAILGLAPSTGTVEIGWTSLAGRRTDERVRAGLGYVPEDRCVFSALTVAENLRLAEPATGKPHYDRVYDLFPELAQRGGQLAGTLSGGQQQMVAIGRVLLGDSKLLLIDEPTKGLAPKVVTEVASVLARVAKTVPILLVEQNLAVIRRMARHAVVLANGQVAWTGLAPELSDDPVLAKSLLGVG